MEGGGGETVIPFWLQSTTNVRRVDRYRHLLSSLFFNAGILLVLLLVTALFFMLFLLPTLSHSIAQIFRPNSVKKSWDSLNLVLVLFALLFGFLSRNRNNDYSTSDHQYHRSNSTNVVPKSNPSTPKNEWYDSYNISDQTLVFNNSATSGGLMRRSSTSYPDLQLHDHNTSTWVTGDDKWQFYDDHRVYYRRPSWKEADKQIVEPKTNHFDTSVSNVPQEECTHVSPPPSPPPRRMQQKRREGNVSRDNFLTAFYQKKKKKKRQRQRSVENLDALVHHSQPPSVFQHLFSSRKGKKRRLPSEPHDVDPPPPFIAARAFMKSTPRPPSPATYKPPLRVNMSTFISLDDNSSSGGSSPLLRMPPPPPPPPFKMRDWKFEEQGDYVSIESEEADSSCTPTSAAEAASSSSFFCPSPDVDIKADNFIARFKAELKLQKINSFNQKQLPTFSNLRPALASTHI